MAFRGIDVSKWQTSIDWKKVKASGITFAIIRASYAQTTDSRFVANIQGALAEGINVGVYVYALAKNTTEAIYEADYVLKLIKPYKISYPVCYDMEDSTLAALIKQQRTDIAIAFCERIESARYYAMIYSNKNWLENMLDYEKLRPYDIWLAQWAPKATWGGNYGIWQYGLDNVDGIGRCDCDVSTRDYPTIIANAKLNDLGPHSIGVGSTVRYQGLVYASSWGIGNKISVNGTFTVKQYIPNRKYGVQINQLGWVAESAVQVL